jgi:hypothetical protein
MSKPIFIAPFKTGIDTDISPFIAPIDSFQDINNFHIHHGYLEKRSGYRRFGYMVHNPIATITAISQANPAVVTAANTFNNGDEILITNVSGMTEVNGNIYTVANAAAGSFELSGIDSTSFTAYSSGGRAATYNSDRIMGIDRYIKSDGSKSTLIFDTTNAAVYNGVTEVFDPLDSSAIMSGSVTDYIWTENWQPTGGTNRLYFTNGKEYDGISVDGIRYYDPSVSTTNTTLFTPTVSSSSTLYGSKLIFTIKQRLVVLHTFENDGVTTSTFPQRARWCKAQNPSLWDDSVAGEGGFVDAPTGDQIISARPLQDALIVFFTNSVWTLRPVSNPALPFRWDKINDYRACNGKMATIQYDRYVMAFGVRGITATDGVETKRVDNRILDFTTDDIDADQFGKVFSSRFFENERMLTLYANNSSENNKALILDDESLAYTKYEISMNCLGYGNLSADYALEDFTAANDLDISINDNDRGDDNLLSFYFQETSDIFLGGNTDGIIYIMNTEVTDDGTEITSNFLTNAWNPYQQEGRESQLNYVDLYVNTDESTQITVEFYKDTDVTPYAIRSSDILPPLGYLASVNNITQANPANVNAPNHGLSTGDVIYIYGVKGMVEISGEYTITVVDVNNFTLDGIDSTSFTAYSAEGQVVKNEYYRTKSWKRVLAGGIGFQHRMRLRSDGINAPLIIEAFQPKFKPRGRRLIN